MHQVTHTIIRENTRNAGYRLATVQRQSALLASVFAMSLVACGPSSPGPSGGGQDTKAMKFISVQNETDGFTKIILDLSKAYTAAHPNVTVELEKIDEGSALQKVQLLSASNDLPELYPVANNNLLRDLIKADLALDIGKTFSELGIYDTLNPTAVDLLKRGSGTTELYAFPLELNVEGFWYNKKLFQENNLAVPETWDELIRVSEALQQKGIQPFAVSGITKWPITRLINGYVIRKYGADAMDRVARGELKITDAGFLEAVRAVQDMGNKGYFGKAVNSLEYGPAQDLFLQGKAAMFYMGSWALRDFNNPAVNKIGADNIGFFNIPLVTDGKGSLEDYSMNVGLITAFSKKKYDPGVGEWMKSVFGSYGNRAMSELGMITGFKVDAVPAGVSPLTKLTLDNIGRAKSGALWFEAHFSPKAQQVAWDNAQLLVNGDISPEQYLSDLDKALAAQQ